VLRLMAQAIHELWMNADPSVMIMPGSVAVSSPRVEPELLHYLDVSWQSIIAGDVDGTASTPYKVDQSAPNLNRYSATRRVARAIFMGTAPTAQQQNTGLDDKQINLGVVQPGERPAIFGDALRRLTNQAKFMHADLGRYWYSMSASLNRIAADKAAQIEAALVDVTIDAELGKYVNGSLIAGISMPSRSRRPHRLKSPTKRAACAPSCWASNIRIMGATARRRWSKPRTSSRSAAVRRASIATCWCSSRRKPASSTI
jgi:hypothetical protein